MPRLVTTARGPVPRPGAVETASHLAFRPLRSRDGGLPSLLRPSRVIALLGILIVVAVLGGAALFLNEKHDVVLLDARKDADNLAQALSMETSRSLEAIDLLLQQRIASIHAAGVATPEAFQAYATTYEIHAALVDEASRLPQVDLLSLVSSDGRVLNSTDIGRFRRSASPIATTSSA